MIVLPAVARADWRGGGRRCHQKSRVIDGHVNLVDRCSKASHHLVGARLEPAEAKIGAGDMIRHETPNFQCLRRHVFDTVLSQFSLNLELNGHNLQATPNSGHHLAIWNRWCARLCMVSVQRVGLAKQQLGVDQPRHASNSTGMPTPAF